MFISHKQPMATMLESTGLKHIPWNTLLKISSTCVPRIKDLSDLKFQNLNPWEFKKVWVRNTVITEKRENISKTFKRMSLYLCSLTKYLLSSKISLAVTIYILETYRYIKSPSHDFFLVFFKYTHIFSLRFPLQHHL